ncbi:hypothetical protein HMPREF3038_01282 [Akkermansia sp. KLE1797]|nr:hypothetical protein HMPREF3038_01282 [Akkermansia sp. KLE1797]KXU52809.1 hypothetical protein HMPREF3039_02975 [Akkermansia sp. KLE1798]KZA04229.1 hypothetical protein HMPREF1326_02152 [Akkermansia sp. KLE1605]
MPPSPERQEVLSPSSARTEPCRGSRDIHRVFSRLSAERESSSPSLNGYPSQMNRETPL